MSADQFPANASFDVINQPFTLFGPDGKTPYPASTADIIFNQQQGIQAGIIFSSQLGASLVLLVILLLMTKGEKRRTLPFILNALALFFNVIRCLLQCIEYTGPFMNFVLVELNYYPRPAIRSAKAVSIAGAVLTFLVILLIELALILQVHIICVTMQRKHQRVVQTLSAIAATVGIGFRFTLMAINCRNISYLPDLDPTKSAQQEWAQSASNIAVLISIVFFSLVFTIKLAFAIKARRSLGFKQFEPMQIIFIMACQTLFVPMIFAIMDYYVIHGAQLNSLVETLVAIFLPLSGMWASAKTNHRHADRNPHAGQIGAIPFGNDIFKTPTSYATAGTPKRHVASTVNTNTLVGNDDGSGTSSPLKEKHPVPRGEERESYLSDFDDLEMQRYGIGRNIQVDKSYTVTSDEVGHAR